LRSKEDFWNSTFQEIKTWDRNKREDFAFWCNGYGAGPVTTLTEKAAARRAFKAAYQRE
jgi:hypothetical protein